MCRSDAKISVIITCYNYQDYVAQAIDSVLEQDCPPHEIIVVDDGSTDGSRDVLKGYASRVKVIEIPNSGSAKACLTGVAASTGDFIHFLDADDFLNPGATRAIIECCKPDVSKVQFSLIPVNADGAVIGNPNPAFRNDASPNELIRQINLRGAYLTPPTSGNVFNRKIFDYVGDLAYERGIDGITYLIAPFLGRVVTIRSPLASYRVHDRNKSGFGILSSNKFDAEAERFITRLDHLSEICATHHFSGLEVSAKLNGNDAQFSYVKEKRILSQLARSERPSLGTLLSYVRAVRSERFGLPRTLFAAAWAASIALMPMSNLRQIAVIRSNPWSRHAIWSWLKRLSDPRVQITALGLFESAQWTSHFLVY